MAVDRAGHALFTGAVMGGVDFGNGSPIVVADPSTLQLIAAKVSP
jgi:hypothetical protein